MDHVLQRRLFKARQCLKTEFLVFNLFEIESSLRRRHGDVGQAPQQCSTGFS